MSRFNHALTLAFTVITNDAQAEDLTWEQCKQAVLERLDALDPANNEWGELEEYKEAVLPPYDTYEEEG